MDRNKKTLIIIAVFGLVIAIVGGTLAYWRWQSSEAQKTVVNFTIGSDFSCADDNSVKPNAPELDTGMIPVVIANDGTVTTVSKDDSNWYDYSSKKWANVVLVNSSSRSNYLNTTGVTIPEDNILAYYVWIPRYKYKIWETGMSSAGKE